MKTISQGELRNRIGRVLLKVKEGQRMRITVRGRAVADLIPIAGIRHTFVARAEIENLLARVAGSELRSRRERSSRWHCRRVVRVGDPMPTNLDFFRARR